MTDFLAMTTRPSKVNFLEPLETCENQLTNDKLNFKRSWSHPIILISPFRLTVQGCKNLGIKTRAPSKSKMRNTSAHRLHRQGWLLLGPLLTAG